MKQFRTWLRAQKNRNDPVGNLARDVAMDKAFPLMADWRVYLNYLYARGAPDTVIYALETAWEQYWTGRWGVEYESQKFSR